LIDIIVAEDVKTTSS